MSDDRRQFYLYQRGSGTWYVQLVSPETGARLTARSTGTTDRDKAILAAGEMLRTGVVPSKRRTHKETTMAAMMTAEAVLQGVQRAELSPEVARRIVQTLTDRGLLTSTHAAGKVDFVTFLETFWSYTKSEYVRDKLAHGQGITKRHCYDRLLMVKNHWTPAFKGRSLASIGKQELKAFALSLSDKGLNPATTNRLMMAGTVALRWAFKNEKILTDPTVGLVQFKVNPEKRGVLTDEELARLWTVPFHDERVAVCTLVAATTGMRIAEVQALRVSDIGADRIFLRHAWSLQDRLKAPKNGETREVPLPAHVRRAVLALAAKNPHGDGFILYSVKAGVPMDQKPLTTGFYAALREIGITEEERKARKIVFHSLRHGFSRKLAGMVKLRDLSLATGHNDLEVLEEVYASHSTKEQWDTVAAAVALAFPEPLTAGLEAFRGAADE